MTLATTVSLSPELAARFAGMALDCVEREYPNKIAHVMSSDADVKPPRSLTPVFYGCFDWHSAVHGHWLLVRLLHKAGGGDAPWIAKARGVLSRHLVPQRIAQEVAYLRGEGRSSFERPYGLAWLLQLGAELAEWNSPEARAYSAALRPLELAAVERLSTWLPKLTHPVRSGEHSQTAFALGLCLDWARAQEKGSPGEKVATDFAALIAARARAFYLQDRACPLHYEPSGEDFLSPGLAEADLMRRVLPQPEFVEFLGGFLPLSTLQTLRPAAVSDRSDGKLVHLDGLNLSRAWMLQGIASALPSGPQKTHVQNLAQAHRDAGLAALSAQNYEGGHWLGSFATYLVTARGIR
jgi:hypothetical protein